MDGHHQYSGRFNTNLHCQYLRTNKHNSLIEIDHAYSKLTKSTHLNFVLQFICNLAKSKKLCFFKYT